MSSVYDLIGEFGIAQPTSIHDLLALGDLLDTDWKRNIPKNFSPQDGTNSMILDSDGHEYKGHYAADLSGSEQPSYNGWFTSSCVQIYKPMAWRRCV